MHGECKQTCLIGAILLLCVRHTLSNACPPGTHMNTWSGFCVGTCGCDSRNPFSKQMKITDGLGDYGPEEEACEWIIGGVNPSVTFDSFDTEEYEGVVTVYRCALSDCSDQVQMNVDEITGTYDASFRFSTTQQFLKVAFASSDGSFGPGFSATWGTDECSDCTAGKYSNDGSVTTCTACPPFSNSPVGSTGCICAPGYSTTSDGSCEACEVGKYQHGLNATECWECPSGTTSPLASSTVRHCSCLAGYSADSDGVECVSCEIGKYKPGAGQGVCTQCPQHSESPAGSDMIDDCVCRAGYTLASDICTECSAGKYKDTKGSSSCALCRLGSYSTYAAEKCTWCQAGYYSNTDNTGCIPCSPGSYGLPWNDERTVGQYDVMCQQCNQGTYSGSGADACTPCPDNSYSVRGRGHCTCVRGYDGLPGGGGPCTACDTGKFKPHFDDGPCLPCPSGSTSMSNSDEQTDCECMAGHTATENGVACSQCNAGEFKITGGIGNCSICPTGTDSAPGSNDVTNCTCLIGFTGTVIGQECTLCDTDSYKDVPGVGNCSNCPYGKTSQAGSDELTDCMCAPGYFFANGEICTMCDAGTYKNVTGAGECLACPLNTNSMPGSTHLTDCVCLAGYRAISDGLECTGCTVGTFKPDPGLGDCTKCPYGTSSMEEANVHQNDCKCLAGYNASYDGETCTACFAGTYKNTTGTGPCLKCPEGTGTASTGSKLLNNCTCLVGHNGTFAGAACTACEAGKYKKDVGFGECVSCKVGTYNSIAGAEECLQCPMGTSSFMGSDELADCKCVAGHNATLDGLPCSACEAGKFKGNEGTGVCESCRAGATTPTRGSYEAAECECAAGYTTGSDEATCVPCQAGEYKSEIGSEPCSLCDSITSSGEKHSPDRGAAICVNCPQFQESNGITCYCKQDYRLNLEFENCTRLFSSSSTFNIFFFIAYETIIDFSGNIDGTGKQGQFLDSVSKAIAITRKGVSFGFRSITQVPPATSRRRLLDNPGITGPGLPGTAQGINLMVVVRASFDKTESIIALAASGNLKVKYPKTLFLSMKVLPDDINLVSRVYSNPITAPPSTQVTDPTTAQLTAPKSTPSPNLTKTSPDSMPIHTIVVIISASVVGIIVAVGVTLGIAHRRRRNQHRSLKDTHLNKSTNVYFDPHVNIHIPLTVPSSLQDMPRKNVTVSLNASKFVISSWAQGNSS
jgi:hypothetical protein